MGWKAKIFKNSTGILRSVYVFFEVNDSTAAFVKSNSVFYSFRAIAGYQFRLLRFLMLSSYIFALKCLLEEYTGFRC